MQENIGNYIVEVGEINGTSMSLEVLSSEAFAHQRLQDIKETLRILESMPRKSNEDKKLISDLKSQVVLGKPSQIEGKGLNIILFSQVRVNIPENGMSLFYENLRNFASQIRSRVYLDLSQPQNELTEPQSLGMKVHKFLTKEPKELISQFSS